VELVPKVEFCIPGRVFDVPGCVFDVGSSSSTFRDGLWGT